MTDRDTETFVTEVEEEVRRERWSRFWKRWGIWIGAAIASVILGVAGFEAYKSISAAQAAAAGEQFASAQAKVAAGDKAGAQAILTELSKSGPPAYRAAALMERAGSLEQAGDLAGAMKAFDEAARQSDAPALKASAALRAAFLAAESETFEQIQARLKPLIDASGPFSFLARELLAVEAIEAGQNAIAEKELSYIRDALDAPPSLQQRAGQFLLAIAPTEPVRPTPAAQTPTPQAPAAAPAKAETGAESAKAAPAPAGDKK